MADAADELEMDVLQQVEGTADVVGDLLELGAGGEAAGVADEEGRPEGEKRMEAHALMVCGGVPLQSTAETWNQRPGWGRSKVWATACSIICFRRTVLCLVFRMGVGGF